MAEFQQDLDNFLYFDGAMPNLAKGVKEVPLPKGYYVCLQCKNVTNHYKDFCAKCEENGERQFEESRGN